MFAAGTTSDSENCLPQVQPEDLLKYGLIPEFIGRLPVVATLDELDEKALIRILTEPRNALTKQYEKLLSFEKVKLKFTEGALGAVARKALHAKDRRPRTSLRFWKKSCWT